MARNYKHINSIVNLSISAFDLFSSPMLIWYMMKRVQEHGLMVIQFNAKGATTVSQRIKAYNSETGV